jgi:2-desacetyl-2-hydroxyethyl bacteriochlorophyllide A dehydrogenase
MKSTPAVVFNSPGSVSVREIAMPDPGPNEVQLRTRTSVISAGTEGWVLENRFTWQPTTYPCVPGYQRTAEVVALGEGVSGWKVGDLAVCTWGRWEAEVASMWGSHALLANTPVDELYRLPEGVEEADAAAFVIAQVGYNAASRMILGSDSTVAVYGDGMIGQFAAQAARARGARVALVGHRDERLATAYPRWVDHVVNRKKGGVVAAVRQAFGVRFVDAVIDTVQTESAQAEYSELLEARKGQIVYSGFTPGTVWADMAKLQQMELTTHFVCGWSRDRLEATLALMAEGKMSAKALITHRVPFGQAPDMYRMIAEKQEPFLGILLDWTTAH